MADTETRNRSYYKRFICKKKFLPYGYLRSSLERTVGRDRRAKNTSEWQLGTGNCVFYVPVADCAVFMIETRFEEKGNGGPQNTWTGETRTEYL